MSKYLFGDNCIWRFNGRHAFLSNFYDDGVNLPVEYHFQAAKTLDLDEKKRVYSAKSPAEAKAEGRKVTKRKDWHKVRKPIMLRLTREKYARPMMKKKLIATFPMKLVEGNNWHDNDWGHCLCKACKRIKKYNMLGKILEQVRDEKIAEDEEE